MGKEDKKEVKRTIRMTGIDDHNVKFFAEKQGISVSSYINNAVKRAIEEDRKNTK